MQARIVTQYSAPVRVLHWLTAIVVLMAFVYGPDGSEERVYAAARDFERQLHEMLGLCVLALVAIRLLWRAFDRRPEPPGPRWLRLVASAAHAALYALLFAVPLSPIGGAWLEEHPLTLLWRLAVPAPVAESHALGATIAEVHTWLGDAIIWLAGAHAAAGLFHHYFLKDGVLRGLLPWTNARRR